MSNLEEKIRNLERIISQKNVPKENKERLLGQAEELKNVLDREHISYQIVYDDNLDKGLMEEEIWRRDARLAAHDKERNKEIAEWDRIQAIDDAKLNKNGDDWEW